MASELSIKLTLPQIATTGFRPPTRPYVAIWVRKDDNTFVSNLAVWYQVERRERREGLLGGRERQSDNPKTPGGARWLNEVRQWWADSGNQLQFPVDGLTSASRTAGTHELTFAGTDPKLARLAPGKYQLMVEAAREHGGEEAISVPFTWPVKATQTVQAAGKTELGAVELTLKR